MSARYYRNEPSFAGEVDHRELIAHLMTFDGWALSCSSASVPQLLALASELTARVRLAVWVRRPKPHRSAYRLTAFEGVIYVPARHPPRLAEGPVLDVLTGVEARTRPTLPGAVIGSKPPAFCAWLFRLLGADPRDTFEDLFPGSGIVGYAWAQWSGQVAIHDGTQLPFALV